MKSAAFRLAPPTRAPSTCPTPMMVSQLAGLTLPPYTMRTPSLKVSTKAGQPQPHEASWTASTKRCPQTSTCTWGLTTTAPTRRRRSIAGWSVILGFSFTSHHPTRRGSIRSSAGSRCSPRSRSAVELTEAPALRKTPSGSISQFTTRIPSPSYGSRPPTTSSPTSLAFACKLQKQDTSAAGRRGGASSRFQVFDFFGYAYAHLCGIRLHLLSETSGLLRRSHRPGPVTKHEYPQSGGRSPNGTRHQPRRLAPT